VKIKDHIFDAHRFVVAQVSIIMLSKTSFLCSVLQQPMTE